jgi:hypothetical protein
MPPLLEWDEPLTAVDTPEELWNKVLEPGKKLTAAMKASDQEAGAAYSMGYSASSPFDSDLLDKLKEWGYNDHDPQLQKGCRPRM